MFSNKKQKFQINQDDPVFRAVYLGKIEIADAREPSSVITAVRALWDRAHSMGPEKLPRVSVALGPHGIFMEDTRPKTKHQFSFSLGNISYCMANKGFKCVFAWVVDEQGRRSSSASIDGSNGSSERRSLSNERNEQKSETGKKLRCHAIVCEREDVARVMALLMTAYFNNAYHDHKSRERRETRKQITKEKIGELEERLSTPSSINDVGPSSSASSSRSASRQSSTRSTKSSSSGEHYSPIHTMVAKAFGLSPKAMNSDPDAQNIAMHHAEEKLRKLQVDPQRISEKGEIESMLNWVSKTDDYMFY